MDKLGLQQLLRDMRALNTVNLLESLDNAFPPSTCSSHPISLSSPPFDLLVSAILNVLIPAPEYKLLSDLIILITLVESWRIRAINVVYEQLFEQAYHKLNTHDTDQIILLAINAECFLTDHEEESSKWRTIFLDIIRSSICIHLRRVWLELDYSDPDREVFLAYKKVYLEPFMDPSLAKYFNRDEASRTGFDAVYKSLMDLLRYALLLQSH